MVSPASLGRHGMENDTADVCRTIWSDHLDGPGRPNPHNPRNVRFRWECGPMAPDAPRSCLPMGILLGFKPSPVWSGGSGWSHILDSQGLWERPHLGPWRRGDKEERSEASKRLGNDSRRFGTAPRGSTGVHMRIIFPERWAGPVRSRESSPSTLLLSGPEGAPAG